MQVEFYAIGCEAEAKAIPVIAAEEVMRGLRMFTLSTCGKHAARKQAIF